MADHYDVIVIGTGAGGGTLAHKLASSGKRILLLERGDFLPREMDNWNPEAVFVDGRYISPDTWFDSDGAPFQPQVHYFVGGATKLYGAALYRLRPQDFAEIRHVDGISPAWPLSYDDFEPWYTEAEWLYQVHGNRGEDPTEGHWSQDYPWPAVSHEARSQEIADALTGGGYHPFSAPVGIMLDEADRARSACIRCAWCDGYPCLVHAKADADIIAVRPLLDQPNVSLLVNAEVVQLKTDASGRAVSGVVVVRDGTREEYSPTLWPCVLGRPTAPSCCCSPPTTDTPPVWPTARTRSVATTCSTTARQWRRWARRPTPRCSKRRWASTTSTSAAGDRPWPLGNIQMIGKSNAGAMKGEEPKLTKLAPHWTLDDVAGHSVDWWLTTEDLPTADNRVTVDGDGHIHLAYTSSNDREAEGLYDELKTILNHVGMAEHHVWDKNFYMAMNIPIAGVAHQAGTCRFGNDPATSVLDANCKAHELDNLYVVDTSFFPSIGAVNPALTAMANALRVGEHLIDRLG